MEVVFSQVHERHAPKTFLLRGRLVDSPEVPERAHRLVESVRSEGHRIVSPDDFGVTPRAAVHTPEYLKFLETIAEQWQETDGSGPEVIPNIHPNRNMSSRPTGPVGLAGYHTADTSCPIGTGTWEAAVASANCAIHAAQLVLDGARVAYALCRPPGHHAYSDMAGGFCYLNNVAIAAQHMAATMSGRIAILDVDVHHGNGTQGVFYHRSDVLTISIHVNSTNFYPFFAGYAHERGEGLGAGYNLNLPLAPRSGDVEALSALETSIEFIRRFTPDALLVALGFDMSEEDPLGIMNVTSAGFSEMARRLSAMELPTVLVQEGGYMSKTLGSNLACFLRAFEA